MHSFGLIGPRICCGKQKRKQLVWLVASLNDESDLTGKIGSTKKTSTKINRKSGNFSFFTKGTIFLFVSSLFSRWNWRNQNTFTFFYKYFTFINYIYAKYGLVILCIQILRLFFSLRLPISFLFHFTPFFFPAFFLPSFREKIGFQLLSWLDWRCFYVMMVVVVLILACMHVFFLLNL